MGFIAKFKAKRAAKRAKAVYESQLYEWNRENVFDAIKFTLDTDDIEFLERIISIEEIG